MAKDQTGRRRASPVKYDNTGKPIKPGVKYDNTGKPINSKPTSKPTPKPTPKTSSSTAQVPKGGVKLPTTGSSEKAKLARSLIKKGVGRLVPGFGLILMAAEVAEYLGGGETATSQRPGRTGRRGGGSQGSAAKERKLQDKLDKLQSRYDKTKELLEKSGGMDTSRMEGANRLLSQIDQVEQQLKDLRGSPPIPQNRPARAPQLTDSGQVGAAPRPRSEREGKELAGRAAERRYGSGPDREKPSTVDTKSKKPIAKRLMELLGDKRTMEQATKDRKMNEEMEMEREMNVAGRKKGGTVNKKKAPVKKAYGGMVKKKQGGSANKANMKAGFTKRGCSKG